MFSFADHEPINNGKVSIETNDFPIKGRLKFKLIFFRKIFSLKAYLKVLAHNKIFLHTLADSSPTNGKLEILEKGQVYDAVDFEKAIELAGN